MWFGDKMQEHLDISKIKSSKDSEFSHDNLFHTLLGIFDVQTEVYEKEMNILKKQQGF